MTNTTHWHIAGRGAIGLLWAYHWCANKHKVTLLDHQLDHQTAQLNQQKTFTIDKLDNTSQTFQCNLEPICHSNQIDYLLLPLKAFDIKTVLLQLQPRLSDSATIILCHNGMGTLDEIQPLLSDKQTLLLATTTHGAYRKDRSHVVHSGKGETKLGVIQTTHRQQNSSIDQGLTPISWQTDIKQVLWHKLAINCVINPLTAINNCKNGELAKKQYRQKIKSLCKEFSLIANAEGIKLSQNEMEQKVYQVIKATAQNYSSMQQDINHQRPSEIDYINGYLIKKAQQHHIAVPCHEALYQQINEKSLPGD